MPFKYIVIAQTSEELQNLLHSPSVTITRYLLQSAQSHLLSHLSVYTAQGATIASPRFLYMNLIALGVWVAMNRNSKIVGQVQQPPRTAKLVLGKPFAP